MDCVANGDIFFVDIIGYDRLKLSQNLYPQDEILGPPLQMSRHFATFQCCIYVWYTSLKYFWLTWALATRSISQSAAAVTLCIPILKFVAVKCHYMTLRQASACLLSKSNCSILWKLSRILLNFRLAEDIIKDFHSTHNAFSGLTLLVGRQKEHPTRKNWVMRCWRGYLSAARCKWFAYGPANATATPSSLASLKSRMVLSDTCCRVSPVCRLSACNARAPYSGGCNFPQYFYGIRYLGHPFTSTENFTEIVPREPLGRGVKHEG